MGPANANCSDLPRKWYLASSELGPTAYSWLARNNREDFTSHFYVWVILGLCGVI